MAVGNIKVTLDRKRSDDLAARLLQRLELDRLPLRSGEADLVMEVSLRNLPKIVTFFVLTLWDRPCAVVLLGPERPAWVTDQHFRDIVVYPIEDAASAHFAIFQSPLKTYVSRITVL